MAGFSEEQLQQMRGVLNAELSRLESHMSEQLVNDVNQQLVNVNQHLGSINERLVSHGRAMRGLTCRRFSTSDKYVHSLRGQLCPGYGLLSAMADNNMKSLSHYTHF